MKKIILILFLLCPCYVLAEEVSFSFDNLYICDENGMYPVYNITHDNLLLVPANRNSEVKDNYTLNKIPFNHTPYNEFIINYLQMDDLMRFNFDKPYTYEFIIRYFWERIYEYDTFSFCNEDEDILNKKELEYKILKQRVDDAIDGFIFSHPYTLKENAENKLQSELLNFYEIVDNGGLDASISGDILNIKGDIGNYVITLRMKPNKGTFDREIFTDKEDNYFLKMHWEYDRFYQMKINIIENPIEVNNNLIILEDENNIKEDENNNNNVYINKSDKASDIISFVPKNTYIK